MAADGMAMQGAKPSTATVLITIKSLIKDAQFPKLKCFSTRLAVAFAQYIEARC